VAVVGQTVDRTVLVANRGSRLAASGAVVLSARNLETGALFELDGCAFPEIEPGAVVNCPGEIRFGELLEPGLHVITATADRLNFIAESNELNNDRSASLDLVPAGGTPTPTPGCPLADLGDDEVIDADGSTDGRPSSLAGASCGGGGAQAPDFSYRYTAPVTGSYAIDTFGSAFDTLLYVRPSCSGPEIACNDDAGGSLQSQVVVALDRGEEIVIVVDGFGTARGAFNLNVSRVLVD
jgi:hypothetical protein